MTSINDVRNQPWQQTKATALLVLADGTVIEGQGLGATGSVVAEVCFNTALTGYQEILTDPSYAGQIVTFTFPHIGNVGANNEDIEDLNPAARSGAVGAIFKADITEPSNYRSSGPLGEWLKRRGVIALTGIDTRALTALIREKGAPNAVIAHAPDGVFDIEALKQQAREWSGLVGLDLAKEVTSGQTSTWTETPWVWNEGYSELTDQPSMHIVAIDYGVKRNILRLLAGLGAKVTVVPAKTAAEDIAARWHLPVKWPRRPRSHWRICSSRHSRIAGDANSGVWHLPWSPDAGIGPRWQNSENASGPSWRKPSSQRPHDRQG